MGCNSRRTQGTWTQEAGGLRHFSKRPGLGHPLKGASEACPAHPPRIHPFPSAPPACPRRLAARSADSVGLCPGTGPQGWSDEPPTSAGPGLILREAAGRRKVGVGGSTPAPPYPPRVQRPWGRWREGPRERPSGPQPAYPEAIARRPECLMYQAPAVYRPPSPMSGGQVSVLLHLGRWVDRGSGRLRSAQPASRAFPKGQSATLTHPDSRGHPGAGAPPEPRSHVRQTSCPRVAGRECLSQQAGGWRDAKHALSLPTPGCSGVN